MLDSRYHKIGQKITKWLSVIPENKTNCSINQIVEKFKHVTLNQDEILISFDVSSCGRGNKRGCR